MNENESDRNLLVGMLGLQLGLYTETQLMAAMRIWSFQRHRPIEEILLENGALIGKQNSFLRDMSQQYLQLHAGDTHQGVASLSVYPSVEKELQGLDDDRLAQTLMIVQSCRQVAPASTKETMGETLSFVPTPATKDQRYRVLRPHASGGLGTVSVAEDRELHREVAIKEMHTDRVQETELRNRFLLEAEVTGRLEHPGIVPVYSLGLNEAGNPYYVMRFIKGESLSEAIGSLYRQKAELTRTEYRFAVRQLVQRLVDVCQAIEYAHSRGVLHRDLKPANVMLGKYGETLVVDWGLAKTGNPSDESLESESVFIAASGDSDPHTQMGSLFGTLEYASPEQAEGRLDKMGPPSDVYSLGATLYSILTGQPAFAKLPLEPMLQKVRTGDFSPPRQINTDVPRALEAICLKAMSQKPSGRYRSAAALAGDLELWLAGEPVSAYAEPLVDQATRLARRHRTAVAAVLVGLVTSLIGLLILNSITRTQNRLLKEARDEARIQNSRSTDSLQISRSLGLTLLSTAEDQLSRPNIDEDRLWKLRNSLTEDAEKAYQQIYALNSSDREIRTEYAWVLRVSANLKRFAGSYVESETKLLDSIGLQKKTPDGVRTLDESIMLAETYRDLGTTAKAKGELRNASNALKSSIDLAYRLISFDESNIEFQRLVAIAELEWAGLLENLDSLEDAKRVAKSSSDFFESLRQNKSLTEQDFLLYMYVRARQIRILHALNESMEAENIANEIIPVCRDLMKRNAKNPNMIFPFSRILYWSAEGLIGVDGMETIATDRMTEAIELSESLVATDPGGRFLYNLGEAYRVRGRLFRCQGNVEQSEHDLITAERHLAQLLAQQRSADHLDSIGRTHFELGLLKRETGDSSQALQFFETAVEFHKEAATLNPENIVLKKSLDSALQMAAQ